MYGVLIACNKTNSRHAATIQTIDFSGQYVYQGDDVRYMINVSGESFSGSAENIFGQILSTFNGYIRDGELVFTDEYEDGLVEMSGTILENNIYISINTFGVISVEPILIALNKIE